MSESIKALDLGFEGLSAEDVLRRTWERFGTSAAMSSSFQTQSVPLLHIVSRMVPRLPIIFLDTGYHFPETLAFRDHLMEAWNLRVRTICREVSPGARTDRPDLYRRDPDLCCRIHKVEPIRRVTTEYEVWISGIRRDQTRARAEARIVEHGPEGMIRVHPILDWSEEKLWSYMAEHDLPKHPLYDQGYRSIGCAPCTRPVQIGEDPRVGRWQGDDKTECGLHTDLMEHGGLREAGD